MWRWTKAATIEALEQRTKGRTVAATKFEILNSKHETNSNYKLANVANRISATRIGFGHLNSESLKLFRISIFGFRIYYMVCSLFPFCVADMIN